MTMKHAKKECYLSMARVPNRGRSIIPSFGKATLFKKDATAPGIKKGGSNSTARAIKN